MARKKEVTEAETVMSFEGENQPSEQPVKKEPAARRSSKKLSMTEGEVANILNMLIGGVAKIAGYRYSYKESDYAKEAAGLVRLSEKFSFILQVLVMVDPLLVLLGLFEKISAIAKTKPKPEPKQEQPQPVGITLIHPEQQRSAFNG